METKRCLLRTHKGGANIFEEWHFKYESISLLKLVYPIEHSWRKLKFVCVFDRAWSLGKWSARPQNAIIDRCLPQLCSDCIPMLQRSMSRTILASDIRRTSQIFFKFLFSRKGQKRAEICSILGLFFGHDVFLTSTLVQWYTIYCL